MSRSPLPGAELCPCGSEQRYGKCCGPWHEGEQHLQAPTAEALMRSRYVAFVQNRLDYLQATWHPTTRPTELEPNPPGWVWLGLQVRRHVQVDDDHAEVEFVARSRYQGRGQRHVETSRFVREQERWLYVDGEVQ